MKLLIEPLWMSPRSKERFEFDTIRLDDSLSESQYSQLEGQIRSAISGRLLSAGTRVPSSRKLAQILGISRNTVLTAYEQLISEGYLETVRGSGTRVAGLPPEAFEFDEHPQLPLTGTATAECLSAAGRRLTELAKSFPSAADRATPFRPHLPAVDEFPVAVWNRFANERARWSSQQLNHCDPQGFPPLREAIAEYMAISRGVACAAEQVVVTSGAQQGLSLVMQLLIEPNDTVWVEEPGNAPANQLLELARARVVPVPLDAEGIDVSGMPTRGGKPKLIYVTPGGQWPMAMTMSLNRRLELLTVAQRHESWVIEDDYNGEFRYTGRPHPALCSLDQSGRTIYMGTFSKMLFPAIRLGFLIVPPKLSQTFAYARWLHDRFSPPLTQMVLHRFIESGNFLKHIRRMRSLYNDRQKFLYHSLLEHLKTHIEVDLPESGLHLVVRGVTARAEDRLIAAAKRAGVEYHSVKMYSREPKAVRGIILGFAAFDKQATEKAIRDWSVELARSSP